MGQSNRGSAYYRDISGQQYFELYQDPQARGGSFLNVPFYAPSCAHRTQSWISAAAAASYLSCCTPAPKVGVDVNPLAVESARKWGIEAFERLEDVPSENIDVVISNHGLLYLPADSRWRQRSGNVKDPNHHLYALTPLLLANLLGEAGWNVQNCRLVFHTWPPRGHSLLRHLPDDFAQAICRACGALLLQPQIHAVAGK